MPGYNLSTPSNPSLPSSASTGGQGLGTDWDGLGLVQQRWMADIGLGGSVPAPGATTQDTLEPTTMTSLLAQMREMKEYIASMHAMNGPLPSTPNNTPTIPAVPMPAPSIAPVPQQTPDAPGFPGFQDLTAVFPQFDGNGKLIRPRDHRNFPKVPFWFSTQAADERKKKSDATVPGEVTAQCGATRLARDDLNVRFPFITDAYGQVLGGHVIAAMRTDLRDHFQKLWDEGRCPDTWFHGASSVIKQEMYDHMYELHPNLALCAFHYKVERLAILTLPGWLETKRLKEDRDDEDEELRKKKKLKLERKERNKEEKREKAREKRQKKKDAKRRKKDGQLSPGPESRSVRVDLDDAPFRLSPPPAPQDISAHQALASVPSPDPAAASSSTEAGIGSVLTLADCASELAPSNDDVFMTAPALAPLKHCAATNVEEIGSSGTAQATQACPLSVATPSTAAMTSTPMTALTGATLVTEATTATNATPVPITLSTLDAPSSLSIQVPAPSTAALCASSADPSNTTSPQSNVPIAQALKDIAVEVPAQPVKRKVPHPLANIYPPQAKNDNAVSAPMRAPVVIPKTTALASSKKSGTAAKSRTKDSDEPWPPPHDPEEKPKATAARIWKALNPAGEEPEYDAWYKQMKTHARRTKWIADNKEAAKSILAREAMNAAADKTAE